jgi:hypothetical protein
MNAEASWFELLLDDIARCRVDRRGGHIHRITAIGPERYHEIGIPRPGTRLPGKSPVEGARPQALTIPRKSADKGMKLLSRIPQPGECYKRNRIARGHKYCGLDNSKRRS